MPDPNVDILRGTLDLLILKALSLAPMHGWSIAQRLEQLSGDALRVERDPSTPRSSAWKSAGCW